VIDNRDPSEVEGNAEDVGVFDVEEIIDVELVGLAAKSAADDLLAEELSAERADAENMGDGIRHP
jgi:hypothetical protein